VTPAISGFVEGDVDIQRRGIASDNADIYGAVAGLSSDLISLFRGEIYAGYQRETSVAGGFAATSAPTYGGQIYYYPTPYLTLSASLNQSFSFTAGASAATSATPAASPDLLQARFEADYAMAAYWRATASIGWARTTLASTSGGNVSAWVANAELDYDFWRNLDITLAYQFSELDASGGTLRGYVQNVTTLGLTYKY
jgi:hypothetical protein